MSKLNEAFTEGNDENDCRSKVSVSSVKYPLHFANNGAVTADFASDVINAAMDKDWNWFTVVTVDCDVEMAAAALIWISDDEKATVFNVTEVVALLLPDETNTTRE